jgi:hypothetical protein
MPISTLGNMSVPLDGAPVNSNLLMPKLQYRFRVNLIDFGVDSTTSRILTTQVMDVTRPTVSFEPITMDVYNSKVNIAGKHTWEPITLNLRDDSSRNVQRSVGEQLQKQFDFWSQASAAAAGSYKFQTDIEILDGGNGSYDPTVIESFRLVGCFIENANYNQLSYSTNDAATVTLSIRYDNAIQYPNNTEDGGNPTSEGIGMGVPRINPELGETSVVRGTP